MWTGDRYDYDDVARALVRLDRPQMRAGTSGQNGKTVPIYFTDPEADQPMTAPGSKVSIQTNVDRPHCNEVLNALKEDVDFSRTGETTMARGEIAIPGVFYITDGGQEGTVGENDVSQTLLQARPAFRHLGYRAVREELNAAQKSRGFLDPRGCAGGRELTQHI